MTWMIFDWLGTVAFAVSGAMVGISRRMDIFGIVVLAVLTAVGGGMVRDVLVGVTPPSALVHPADLLLSVTTACLVAAAYAVLPFNVARKRQVNFLYNVSDTIGLAAFTVTGVLVGMRQPGAQYVLPMMLACITAVGGGMLRDLMAQKVPVVLRMDVYAVASLAGAFLMCAAWPLGQATASWLGFIVVLLLRSCALRFGWQLYHPHPRRSVFRKRRIMHLRKDDNQTEKMR